MQLKGMDITQVLMANLKKDTKHGIKELKDLQVQIKLLLKKVMSHEIKRKLVVKELILMDIS